MYNLSEKKKTVKEEKVAAVAAEGCSVSVWSVTEKETQRMRLALLGPKILHHVHSFILLSTLISVLWKAKHLGPTKSHETLVFEDFKPNSSTNEHLRHRSTSQQ